MSVKVRSKKKVLLEGHLSSCPGFSRPTGPSKGQASLKQSGMLLKEHMGDML